MKEEDERPLTQAPSKVTPTEMTDHRDVQDMSVDMMDGANEEEEEEEEEEESSTVCCLLLPTTEPECKNCTVLAKSLDTPSNSIAQGSISKLLTGTVKRFCYLFLQMFFFLLESDYFCSRKRFLH